MGKMITAQEAAERLGLKPKTVYAMIAEGDIPGYKIGRAVRLDEDELEAWKAARKIAPSPAPIRRAPGRPAGSPGQKHRDPRWRDAPADQIYTGLACLSRNRKKTEASA